jgi:hypothetical protein
MVMLRPDFSAISTLSHTLRDPSSIVVLMKKSPVSPGVGVCALATRGVVDFGPETDEVFIHDAVDVFCTLVPQEVSMSGMRRKRRKYLIRKNYGVKVMRTQT